MLEKCVLVVTGEEATEACGTDKICGGLEAGIEGGIHVVRLLWQKQSQEEDWRFLLIDARNAFNEENRKAMLWAVQFDWRSGTRFGFNCYRHWDMLVIRAGDGTGQLLFIREGVTQGDPLSMVAYGLKTLPLIRELRKAHPSVTQTCYAANAGAGGTFEGIQQHLDDLMVRGPLRGYLTNPKKRILVVSPRNVPQAEAFFWGYGPQIATGIHHLEGFVGTKAAQDLCLGEKVDG